MLDNKKGKRCSIGEAECLQGAFMNKLPNRVHQKCLRSSFYSMGPIRSDFWIEEMASLFLHMNSEKAHNSLIYKMGLE